MKKGDFIFVYGTLRKGERADLSKNAKAFSVSFMGLDAVNGLLYHLGGFPGLKLIPNLTEFNDSEPTVKGEVFFVKDASVGAILDAYEGYNTDNPDKGLYDRQVVETMTGRAAWVYTYNPVVVEDQLIETGDWKNPRLSVTRKIPNIRTL